MQVFRTLVSSQGEDNVIYFQALFPAKHSVSQYIEANDHSTWHIAGLSYLLYLFPFPWERIWKFGTDIALLGIIKKNYDTRFL